MNEIYWITRLDTLSGWLITFSIIAGIVIIFSTIFYFVFRDEYEQYGYDSDKNWMSFSCKTFKVSTPIFVLFSILTILVPTTKEAMLIFGVGSTIDYISENEVAKQIPDNCIKALNEWVESLSDNENDSKNR